MTPEGVLWFVMGVYLGGLGVTLVRAFMMVITDVTSNWKEAALVAVLFGAGWPVLAVLMLKWWLEGVLAMTPGLGPCPTCGAGYSFRVPVWEDMADYQTGAEPDYVGCMECHTMEELGSEKEDKNDG